MVEQMLYSTHMMLAHLTKTPEFMLEKGEAEVLGQAVANVASYYDVGGTVAPEALAWMSLVQTAALVYGPRLFAVRARKKKAETENNAGQFAPGMMGMAA